jgi:hypothetical protein
MPLRGGHDDDGPRFAIKNQVQRLIDVQIDTLRKPSPLSSSELDEYRSRSERISALYEPLDLIRQQRPKCSIAKRPREIQIALRGRPPLLENAERRLLI